MATVYGSKVNNVWRAYMTYTVATTPTQVKVSITSGLNIPNDGYKSVRSFTCTISGTGQTTVSGSISSASRVGVLTKAIKSVTYTWNRASTAQTKTIKTVLKGGGESTTSSCSASISIPALAPATITFNANGGSGTVPTAISTYVGVANTIPSNSLTRTGYTFNGWNTASDGSGTAYATGSTITPSGNVTLYAQWKTTYAKPEIQNLLAFRTANASGGVSPTVTSTGKTGFCKFQLVGGANYTFTSATVQFGTATAKSMTKSGSTLYGYSTVGSIAQASAYTVKVTVVVKGTDGVSRTYTDSTYISKSVPVFDVSNDGNCFAFFGTAIDGLTSPKLLINGELALGTALSIANGGTGATNAAAARSNLGIGNLMNYISVQLSSDFTLTNSYKQIPLAQVLKNGSLFEISGGGVKCLASGTIEVHATAYLTLGYTASDLVNAQVYKNGTGINYLRGNIRAVAATPYTTFSINGFIEVTANDIITLYVRNQTGSRGKIGAGGPTKMDIKYIK